MKKFLIFIGFIFWTVISTMAHTIDNYKYVVILHQEEAPVFVMRYPNRELPTQRPADIAPAAEDPYEALSWKS